jgi:2-dehydro-3-deoxyglucarate aldolase
MSVTAFKRRLLENRVSVGSWITLGHPAVAEIMAAAGFDWLAIDMEHSVITLDVAQQLIQCIESRGVVPLVRLPENNATTIKRVMDAGAAGVIVPMVNGPEDATRAVRATKYPPRGCRGLGIARAQGYGASVLEYVQRIEENAVVIVQIEDVRAVSQIDLVFQVPGIDGYLIGPFDLSASMGYAGQLDHPEVAAAVEKVFQSGRRHGICAGFHVIPPSTAEIKKRFDQGYRFLAYSLDVLFLGETCRNGLETLRAIREAKTP